MLEIRWEILLPEVFFFITDHIQNTSWFIDENILLFSLFSEQTTLVF